MGTIAEFRLQMGLLLSNGLTSSIISKLYKTEGKPHTLSLRDGYGPKKLRDWDNPMFVFNKIIVEITISQI